MDHRQLVRTIAAGRVFVGAVLMVIPGPAGSRWIGDATRDPRVKVMVRAMGARDLVLGVGTLQALSGPSDQDAARWAQLSALSDAVDAVASVVAIRRLGPRALPVLASAVGAAVLGAAGAERLT